MSSGFLATADGLATFGIPCADRASPISPSSVVGIRRRGGRLSLPCSPASSVALASHHRHCRHNPARRRRCREQWQRRGAASRREKVSGMPTTVLEG